MTPSRGVFDCPAWVVLIRLCLWCPHVRDQPSCCDFCFNQDIPLFEGGFDSTTRICAFCATRALAEITPQPVPEPAPPPERPSKEALLASIPSPKTLVAHLDQFVIGQDIAKRRLALGVSNHFKRLVDAWDQDAPDPIIADPDLRDVVVEKCNILLIGPSGSGKTHLVKSLASYLNVPLVIGDATSLTEAGYVGDDVESLLSRLIQAADGDMEVAQRGIVYIDEIDKIKTEWLRLQGHAAGRPARPARRFSKARSPRCHRRAAISIRLNLASPSTRPTSCSSAAGRSWGWKTSSPSGSGGVGSGSVRCLKTARWRLMGCCGR